MCSRSSAVRDPTRNQGLQLLVPKYTTYKAGAALRFLTPSIIGHQLTRDWGASMCMCVGGRGPDGYWVGMIQIDDIVCNLDPQAFGFTAIAPRVWVAGLLCTAHHPRAHIYAAPFHFLPSAHTLRIQQLFVIGSSGAGTQAKRQQAIQPKHTVFLGTPALLFTGHCPDKSSVRSSRLLINSLACFRGRGLTFAFGTCMLCKNYC